MINEPLLGCTGAPGPVCVPWGCSSAAGPRTALHHPPFAPEHTRSGGALHLLGTCRLSWSVGPLSDGAWDFPLTPALVVLKHLWGCGLRLAAWRCSSAPRLVLSDVCHLLWCKDRDMGGHGGISRRTRQSLLVGADEPVAFWGASLTASPQCLPLASALPVSLPPPRLPKAVAWLMVKQRQGLSLSHGQPCLVPPSLDPGVRGALLPCPSASCSSQGASHHSVL